MATIARTVEQLTDELVSLQNERDEAVSEYATKMRLVRKQRDQAIAQESANKKLATMSEDEIAAVKAELGLEA